MPQHRGLSLKVFVRAMPWDLFERYFAQLEVENSPSGWAFINHQAMEAFLNDPENTEASGIILEDFRRINDICGHGMSILIRAYDRFGLNFDQDTRAQELAMRLFLDHRHAFEFAWSRYLLFGSTSKLSHHRIPIGGFQIGDDEIVRFRDDLQRWFARLAKGDTCEVRCFDDADEKIILITRGTYMRTLASWEKKRIVFRTFRPASEDVMVFDSKASLLSIKASLAKDRQKYLQAFASCIAGDPGLADIAQREQVFTLVPLQDSTFDFAGDGEINSVELVKVRLKLYGVADTQIEVKSKSVIRSFSQDLKGLSLASGELTFARFRFHLQPEAGEPAVVTFEIEPPSRTDLAQKKYADVIGRYLVEQGVKLS